MPPTDLRSPMLLSTDLLVVGAGAAGVAAAVTAARQGLKVTLIERYGFAGGGAVAGLSGTICGMYEASDNPSAPPRQVVHGFLDEFVARMEQKNGLTPPVKYGKTYTRVHDPLVWREVADDLLTQARVHILYHTAATSVLMDSGRGGGKIEGITAWNKQGPTEIRAKLTIDASGDADLVAMAGFDSFIGHEGRVQNPTMIFRLLGVDLPRFLAAYGADTIMPPPVTDLILQQNAARKYDLPRAKIWLFPTTRPGELLCNCTRILGSDRRELNTLFAQDFTEAEIEGRRQVRQYAAFFKDHLAGCEHSFINDTAPQVGVRQTRQALGVATLQNSDITRAAKFPHAIARSPWPIELHSGDKPKVQWLLNDVYEIPYNCFVPAQGEGLLFAGRCLSAQHEAVASARVTAQCFSYGHAIGHASALSIQQNLPPRQIKGEHLRQILNHDNAQLD